VSLLPLLSFRPLFPRAMFPRKNHRHTGMHLRPGGTRTGRCRAGSNAAVVLNGSKSRGRALFQASTGVVDVSCRGLVFSFKRQEYPIPCITHGAST
jgi:hypothetical protein